MTNLKTKAANKTATKKVTVKKATVKVETVNQVKSKAKPVNQPKPPTPHQDRLVVSQLWKTESSLSGVIRWILSNWNSASVKRSFIIPGMTVNSTKEQAAELLTFDALLDAMGNYRYMTKPHETKKTKGGNPLRVPDSTKNRARFSPFSLSRAIHSSK